MGRLQMKATEYKNKENDRQLKEELISSINDNTMTTEIIKGLTSIKNTS